MSTQRLNAQFDNYRLLSLLEQGENTRRPSRP